MSKNELMKQLLLRCKNSPIFFIENFCKVKHPKAGVIPFKLFSYQKESLAKFRKFRFNIYKKTRQCFAGSSRVWTPNGPVRIDSIKKGDLVYSLVDGNLVAVPAADVYHNGRAECVEISTKTGHRSLVTADHKFLTTTGYLPAAELTSNDILVEVHEPQKFGTRANESEAILLGYLLTDGYCGKRSHHFTNTCWRYLLEFQKHYNLRFKQRLSIKPHRHSGFGYTDAYRLYSYNNECKEWLRDLGILGLTKRLKKIPEIVFSWDNHSIALLLNRMFAADGWYSGSSCNEVGIGQISVDILHQIKQLLSRFGINCKIYENSDPIPKLRIIGGPDFEKFVKEIGIFGKEPRIKLTKGFLFNRQKGQFKSRRQVGEHDVYDLSVPPSHNYIVDGAVVHNCGVSTLSGVFALWYAMFYSHKTVLIVSKRDLDATSFLDKNIKFVYDHLPEEFKKIYGNPPAVYNEHTIKFPNGSTIQSLTSSNDTLRSNSSSLNILDEVAFMPDMDAMWSGGYSTLMHGGSVIAISTTNGMGNWYHLTWEDAIAGKNEFNPIEVNWWDMDWTIEYKDEFTNQSRKIAPRDNIRECKTKDEKNTWGKYYSPWLEEQYRALQQKGEAHLFRQEILAEFIGTGNTVLPAESLIRLRDEINDNFYRVERVDYIHPATEEKTVIDFENQLWIWKKPVRPTPPLVENGRIIKPGIPGHSYTIGVDVSTGEADDYSAVEVIDVTEKEQVAELNIKVMPNILAMMVDYLARYYNMAYVVPERTGIGAGLCNDLYYTLGYPNIFRMKNPSGTISKKIGFPTSPANKPTLTKCLLDHLTNEDDVKINSRRLFGQLAIFIHLGGNKVGNVKGPGNHDDLSIGFALALIGILEAAQSDQRQLIPTHYIPTEDPSMSTNTKKMTDLTQIGGLSCVMPIVLGSEVYTVESPQEAVRKFQGQLGGLVLKPPGSAVVSRRHDIMRLK